MDLKLAKFGEGTREVGGGVDLINHYNLRPIHELFCKRSLCSSTLESHYLQNVVGEIVIRKGEGMELDQLLQKTFSAAEKGRPTSSLKLISDSKDKKKVQIREDEHNKCSKLNRRGDGIRNEHLEFGSVHLKMLKDKQKNLKVKKSGKPQKIAG